MHRYVPFIAGAILVVGVSFGLNELAKKKYAENAGAPTHGLIATAAESCYKIRSVEIVQHDTTIPRAFTAAPYYDTTQTRVFYLRDSRVPRRDVWFWISASTKGLVTTMRPDSLHRCPGNRS